MPVHSSGSDVKEHYIARLIEECCGFRACGHRSPICESGPCRQIMTRKLKEMMSHGISLAAHALRWKQGKKSKEKRKSQNKATAVSRTTPTGADVFYRSGTAGKAVGKFLQLSWVRKKKNSSTSICSSYYCGIFFLESRVGFCFSIKLLNNFPNSFIVSW